MHNCAGLRIATQGDVACGANVVPDRPRIVITGPMRASFVCPTLLSCAVEQPESYSALGEDEG